MKRFSTVFLLLALLAFAGAGCGNAAKKQAAKAQGVTIREDVTKINRQQEELRANEPIPHFKDSAALHVQNAWYTADADPNKVWYVILVNYLGEPYAQYTTKGAPQPSDDQITNPQQLYCQHIGGNTSIPDGCGTVGLPEPNGVHQGGGGGSYIAILTTGAIIRFPADTAHVSDQPFNIKGAVHMSINEDAPISKTDTSKAEGAVVPTGTGTREK